jgi:hypothetical protein
MNSFLLIANKKKSNGALKMEKNIRSFDSIFDAFLDEIPMT